MNQLKRLKTKGRINDHLGGLSPVIRDGPLYFFNLFERSAAMDDFDRGYQTALRFISKRMKTEAEVIKKLSSLYSDQVAEQVIERLKDDGYIDDAYYVDCYIRDRMKFNPMGRHRIKMELEQKGIEKNLIENSREYLAIDEKKMIEGLLKTKLKGCDIMDEKQKRRLLGYLTRRGFSFEAINQVLAQRCGRTRP